MRCAFRPRNVACSPAPWCQQSRTRPAAKTMQRARPRQRPDSLTELLRTEVQMAKIPDCADPGQSEHIAGCIGVETVSLSIFLPQRIVCGRCPELRTLFEKLHSR